MSKKTLGIVNSSEMRTPVGVAMATPVDETPALELAAVQRAFERITERLASQPIELDPIALQELTQFAHKVNVIVSDLTTMHETALRASKHDHSAFGILKGKLELDGIACIDGLDFQNRIRSEWRGRHYSIRIS